LGRYSNRRAKFSITALSFKVFLGVNWSYSLIKKHLLSKKSDENEKILDKIFIDFKTYGFGRFFLFSPLKVLKYRCFCSKIHL
jgi:hypothetical protein